MFKMPFPRNLKIDINIAFTYIGPIGSSSLAEWERETNAEIG